MEDNNKYFVYYAYEKGRNQIKDVFCLYKFLNPQLFIICLFPNVKMTRVEQQLKILKTWHSQTHAAINGALEKLAQAKNFPIQEMENISTAIYAFHKDIGKAKQEDINIQWYQSCISIKKKLKKLQDAQKEKQKKAKVQRKPVIVEYPQALLSGRTSSHQNILRAFYKNFLTNFKLEGHQPTLIPFLHDLLKQIRNRYDNYSMKSEQAMFKRINSICNRLSRESSAQCKQKILKGLISAQQLSRDDQQTYFDQKTRETIKKNELARLQQNQSGFYDKMKRMVNKDACQECRFCHKNKAFCEDMKQIRASDQPMTRFMRCNDCNKAWRD